MNRHHVCMVSSVCVTLGLGLLPILGLAQTPQPAASAPTPEAVILSALSADPITAPYTISVERRNGRIRLKGRVGSRRVHDAVIRIAIATDPSIGDDLIIDTNEANRSAPKALPGSYAPPLFFTTATNPPPLFGRFDDPFFGLEAPLITFPANWSELSSLRLGRLEKPPVFREPAPQLPDGTVEMTIDPLGVALLRGTVPTQAGKIAIGQESARMPGVTQVINQLIVRGTDGPDFGEEPPPPPTPAGTKPRMPKEELKRPIAPRPSVPAPPIAEPPPAADVVGARSERAVKSRPELADGSVSVRATEGVATLSGTVPTVFEAMIAYRTVQQTPGVRSIVDKLQFVVPDGREPNPLLSRGKPEDIEPYLLAQIARHVGESVQIDRVRLTGDSLRVVGSVVKADAKPRIEAILRSMPILRGFHVLPEFRSVE